MKADVALCRAFLDLSTYQKPAGGCSQIAKIVWAGDRRAPSLKWMIKHQTTSCQAPFTPEGCFPWLPQKADMVFHHSDRFHAQFADHPQARRVALERALASFFRRAAGLCLLLEGAPLFGLFGRPERKATIFAGPPFKDKPGDQKGLLSL